MGKIRVMGGSDWLPVEGNDGASYIFGEHTMVDLGWGAPVRLLMAGEKLGKYHTLLFTHMHADHIMGLPQLILGWRIEKNKDLGGLTIIGPDESLKESYERANIYAFEGTLDAEVTVKPRLVELKPWDEFETDEFLVRCMPSLHAAPGRCYVLTEKATGRRVGLSGDTAWREEFADFFRGADLLIHECSFGTSPVTPENNSVCKHSSVYEAARVAKESGAKALMLTHTRGDQEACMALAHSLVDIPVYWARTGVTVEY